MEEVNLMQKFVGYAEGNVHTCQEILRRVGAGDMEGRNQFDFSLWFVVVVVVVVAVVVAFARKP